MRRSDAEDERLGAAAAAFHTASIAVMPSRIRMFIFINIYTCPEKQLSQL